MAVALGGWCLAPQHIRAEPLPFAPTLSLGRPIHPVPLSFVGGDRLTLVAAGKRHVLPARSASEVTLELARVSEDAAVAVLRVNTPEGAWLGLLGGRGGSELLLFERADASGDPGERRAREILVASDGSVHTGIRYEGVTACGRPAWLDARKVDPTTLALVPASQPALPTTFEDAAVTLAAPTSAPPALPALSVSASSELDPLTLLPRVPRALVDGDLTKGVEGRTGGLFTMRWGNGVLPIERLELTLRSGEQPVELWWLGEGERAVRARLPGAGVRRVAIVPPAPVTGRCVALILAAGDRVELRELFAYSALDQPDGLERAIALMVQDDAKAGPLADQLEQLGAIAAERLAARWPELSVRGKRRSLKVLARAIDRPAVRAAVVGSARGEDRELRDAAIATLVRAGEPGRPALRELAMLPGPVGDQTVAWLASQPGELPVLLAAVEAEGGSERSSVRAAIERTIAKDPARAHDAIASWLVSTPSVSAQIVVALAAGGAGQGTEAAQLAEPNLERAQSFADRYRLARALVHADPSASADAWLSREAEHASEWMQRRAAFEALTQRRAANVGELADKLSHDTYPRVRAATLVPLLTAGRRTVVDVLLVQDGWPLVRAEAALALAHAPESRAALETALGDPSAR
ncbi:MAG TPA: hypothetical protein VI299_18210, partial [Polyangiales bacterium]